LIMHLDVRVQTGDFDVAAEYAALRRRLPSEAGAVASFVGLVRDLAPPAAGAGPVRALYLEHYPGMTARSTGAIAEQGQRRWTRRDRLVVRRVGRLEPPEQIGYVQVAASHRAAAFAACEFVMDYLKTDAVFWKREDTEAGGRWVEATRDDRRRVSAWAGA